MNFPLITLLRVSPTLTHYSDIVSDIPSGNVYGIYILTFFLAYTLALYLTSFLAFILSGIYSDILSGILSGFCRAHSIRSWRDGVPHSTASWAGDLEFGSRRDPLHPGLAIWCPALTPQCKKTEGGEEGGGRGGVAPLLRSRV